MKTKQENPLIGMWVITCKQHSNFKGRWITEKRFPFEERIWSFTQESNTDTFRGTVEELDADKDPTYREYGYSQEDKVLQIDPPESFAPVWQFDNGQDLYRVRIRKNKLILSDIPEEDDPEYIGRFILKKDTRFNRLAEKIIIFLSKK